MTHSKLKNMLDMLDTLREQFLSLPDDMLLKINPSDNASLEKGYQFIKSFNEHLQGFQQHGNELERLIKNYFEINPEEEELEKEYHKDKIIKELDSSEAHYMDEDFTYKRPYGFLFDEIAVKGVKTWKSLHLEILKILNEKNSIRFKEMVEDPKFISNRGNPTFSTNPKLLRNSALLTDKIYVEVNLSANSLAKNILEFLEYFELKKETVKVYLREDRDA